MRKITDFIVKKRYFFLILFSVLAIFCLYLNTKVNINEDIMKYLPKDSETKIGKDIMDSEFAKQDTSTLNVMFKGLSDKKEILEKLEKVEGVSSVKYEDNDKYNKDDYTLYILEVSDYADSKTSTDVYHYVKDNFHTVGMSGTIYDENKPLLQLWIVILAILCAMVILTILSESYVEPWLYLISIGIAVFINKGTNIIFDSVSSITDSIVAILQLALSMDYSIMLSNRYQQEKEKHHDNIIAMKEALYHSFAAISSSSVTTIVGLLALVFMSFTIGKDLGFVLAKGVLLSLLSIFFCLPALLLIFDKLITKTRKKVPNFNLTKLGKYSYKTRFIQALMIVILFVVAYLLKGNITVLYTGSEQDKVGKVFPATNQIAIVYENQYEEIISKMCKSFENNEKIDDVLCYSNTLNEKLAFNELNNKFKDLGQDTEIEEYLIKIIYYNYYNKDKSNKMTLNEFINFIKKDIYHNENLNKKIDNDTKKNIDLLANFTSKDNFNKKRSIKDIASILGMSTTDAEKILIFYNSKNVDTKMTIRDFVNFMLKDVVTNKEYSKKLSSDNINKLKQLQVFTDTNVINKKMNSDELSNIFGIRKELIEQLFLFYHTQVNSNTKLSLNEFSGYALTLSNDDNYKKMFDDNIINSLKMLNNLSNENVINEKMDMSSMKSTLSNLEITLDDNSMLLLYIYYTGSNTNSSLTLNTFSNIALKMSNDENYQNYFNENIINSLKNIVSLNDIYDKTLDNNTLYGMFNISSELGNNLNYVITGNLSGTFNMTPKEFVNLLLQKEEIRNNLSSEQKEALNKALYIMNNINTLYKVDDLSKALSLDKQIVSVIYGVYDYQNNKLSNISLKEMINFLDSNKNNKMLNNYLKDTNNLLMAKQIVNNTSNKFSYQEISNITNTDVNKVKIIYGVYDYNNSITTMKPLEFVNIVLNNKDNELLKGKITNNSLKELMLVKEVMNSTLNNTKYNSKNLSNLLGIDNNTLSLVFSLYNSKYIKSNQEISLYNFVNFVINSVMNNKEYSSSFDNNKKNKLNTINKVMNNSLKGVKYTSSEAFGTLKVLSNNIDSSLIELVYIYYGSDKEYDNNWKLTIEEFINYLNSDILKDSRFGDFITNDKRKTIKDAKEKIDKSKKMLVSSKYSRIVLNTKYPFENEETFNFINDIHREIGNKDNIYVVGNSPMAVEMSKTFNDELNKITILTMIFIFIVVAFTFKDLIIPFVLVVIIQTAVYATMSVISLTGGTVYFISLLIVQAILMGATIDYAIVYTEYYRELRLTMGVKDAIINAYNRSIHTILSSSLILIIVTLVVANFASAIAAKICETISQGTLAAVILILLVLPGVLAATDKFICRKGYYKEK